MRLGLLHHKDPTGPVRGADLARLRGLSTALRRLGVDVALVAPITVETIVFGSIPALPLSALSDSGRFDLVKACWHLSLELANRWNGPLVCRLVRVVDEERPARDEALRERLLACQEFAAQRAAGLVFNNRENARRWIARHGRGRLLAFAPPGCPANTPPASG